MVGLLGLLLAATAWAADPRAQFQRAIHLSDIAAIEALLGRPGVPPDLRTERGKSALMAVAGAGRLDLVERLLEAGVPAAQANQRGGTPLMYAATGGNPAVVERLLAAGARVDAVAGNGWTALTLAAAKGHVRSVRILLAAGADPNIPDQYGWTALMRAVELNREVVVTTLLETPGIRVDAVDDGGASALFKAVVGGSVRLVERLLGRGANPLLADHQGRTPLSVARGLGREGLVQRLRAGAAGRSGSAQQSR